MKSDSKKKAPGVTEPIAAGQLATLKQIALDHSLGLCVLALDGGTIETVNDDCLSPEPSGVETSSTNHFHLQIPLTDNTGKAVAQVTLAGSNKTTVLERALKERDDQLAVLHSLMADLLTYKALDPLLQKIAEIMIGYTSATNALILLVDEPEEYIQVVAAAGDSAERNINAKRERGVGFAGVAWETGETQYIENSDQHSVTKNHWPARTQLLAVPLTVSERVIGVAVLGAPSDGSDFSRSASVVNNLANLASYAIATADSLDKTKRDLRLSKGISEISHLVTASDNTNELLRSVSKTLVESFDFARCAISKVNENGDLYCDLTWIKSGDKVEAAEGMGSEVFAESSSLQSYQKNEMIFIPRKAEGSHESTEHQENRKALNIGCSVTMPISINGEVQAVMFICKHLHQRDCDENELNMLSSIVQQLSTAIYGINATAALQHQAYHDSLTGLPNRRKFEAKLQQQLNDRTLAQKPGALLFLDLDGFKAVNDTLGHQAGDQLLQLVADRLVGCTNNSDCIARIGGDEFAVIIPAVGCTQEAYGKAQIIRESVLPPFTIGKSAANIGTSIGMCFFPTDGDTVDVLLRNADEAMYHAKKSGKNNVACFEKRMLVRTQNRSSIESELHGALARGEFLLHYQPQVDPVEQRVEAAEALLRWQHPQRGMIPPDQFIPVAEETGLINEIGGWVLEESISQLAKWKTTHLSGIRVSINIAASQFFCGDFSSHVERNLMLLEVPPEMLEVELTERVVMKDINQVITQLEALRSLGVTVALDDFGTGYSSLSYLQDLPVDVLKIDRSFVARLTDEKPNFSIVNTIVLLASGLGLKTVAEGVETRDQLDQIVELGCSLIQGYYYSKPCSIDEFDNAVFAIENQFGNRKAA